MSYENDCSCNYKPFIRKYSVSVRECKPECERKPVCPPPPKPPCCRPCRPICPPRPCREERHEEGYPCCWCDEHVRGYEEKSRGHSENSDGYSEENGRNDSNNSAPEFAVWEPNSGVNIGGDNIETGY